MKSWAAVEPIPDHVAFGDPEREPACAANRGAYAYLFATGIEDDAVAARRWCHVCPLGPQSADDMCWSFFTSHPELANTAATWGGRTIKGAEH